MSFIVQIWESPPGSAKPTTRQQADALQKSLGGKPGTGNERWTAFTQRMLDRYPDEPSDAGDETSVWKDNSLSLGIAGPVAALAIVDEHVDVVLPFVVVTANRFGLNVTNFQSGSIWMADGDVFALDDEQLEIDRCLPALSALRQGDQRAAWWQFIELADAGNRIAVEYLARMYHRGQFVSRKPYVACALFMAAGRWRVIDGVVHEPAGAADDDTSLVFARRLRAALDAQARSMGDGMLPGLLAPGHFKAELLQAYTTRERAYAKALEMADAGDIAGCAEQMYGVARLFHEPAQRSMARLWALNQAEPVNPAEELGWTLDAARQGDDVARHRMGTLMAEGVLMPRDVPAALKYLEYAARKGSSAALRATARKNLAVIGAPLSESEIASGTRLAAFGEQFRRGEGLAATVDLVKAQALNVLAARVGNTRNAFIGIEQVDPYAVRKLVDELEEVRRLGGDVSAVLAKAAPAPSPFWVATGRRPAPAAPAPAPRPRPRPRPRPGPPPAPAPSSLSDEEDEHRRLAEAHARRRALAARLAKARSALVAAMILWLAAAVTCILDPGMPAVLLLLAGAVPAAWGVVALERAQQRPASNALAGALAMFVPVLGFAYAAICVVRIRRALARPAIKIS
jgi:TPR repeat protein